MNRDVLRLEDVTVLGSSHDGKFEYWTEDGVAVYQRNVWEKRSAWFCAMSAWDSTFSKAGWIALAGKRVGQ